MNKSTLKAPRGITFADIIVEAFDRYKDADAFIAEDGRRMTYSECARRISQFQQVLEEEGIVARSAVAALSPNTPEVWLTQAAMYLTGSRYSGLHPLGSPSDHVFLCDDAEIEVLIVHPQFAKMGEEIAQRSKTVRRVLTYGPVEGFDDLLQRADRFNPQPLRSEDVDENDIAWIAYTGGTTGHPKGVVLTQGNYAHQTLSAGESWQIPDKPRYLVSAPITHAAVLPVMAVLSKGGTVLTHMSFQPEKWLQTVQEENVNCSFVVPTMLYAMMDTCDPSQYDLSSLETVIYGASPMLPQRITEAKKIFGDVLLQIYGQTECMGAATTLQRQDHDPVARPSLLTSCGRAVAGARVEVLDEDGQPLPSGVIGELCVRSRAVMHGYWKQPEMTKETLRDGWLRTGDLAKRDEAGYFHIVDRKKDMIISGAFNVYPREVEDAIAQHPGVSAAAVIGVPDPKWGEAVHAFVTPRTGTHISADEIKAVVKKFKGSHQAPKEVHIMEKLPVTNVGKIDKKPLRAQFWSSQERMVN